MIKTSEGEFYPEGEEIQSMPPTFEFLDTYKQSYVYGQKGGRWGRLVTWYPNFQGYGSGWLVEKIDIARHCCTA